MRYQYDKGSIFRCIDTALNFVIPNMGEYRFLILTSLVEHTEMLAKYVRTKVDRSIKVGCYYGEMSPEAKKDTKENAKIILLVELDLFRIDMLTTSSVQIMDLEDRSNKKRNGSSI